jgi:protein gp37
VFCASLADVFDNQIDASSRHDLFALIAKGKRLDWLLLTKRPESIERMLPSVGGDGYSNVWVGQRPKIRCESTDAGGISARYVQLFASFLASLLSDPCG